MPDQPRQKVGDIRLDHDQLVFATQASGQACGDLRIVEGRLPHSILSWKRNGIGSNRLVGCPAHHSHDAGGVEPSAQKRSNRNVADHLRFDRSAEALANFFRQVVVGARVSLTH